MARFFFDSTAGLASVSDDLGLDLANVEAAKHHALAGLADLVQEEIGKGATCFVISVRDEDGAEIYQASLTLLERSCASTS